MRRVLTFALCFVIAVFIIGPTKTYAAGCEHNFVQGSIKIDVCTKCGAIRPDIDAPYELPFIIREDNVVARKAPRQNSAVVKTYKLGTRISVVARIRNEHNNMWLKLSDGSFMFSDRAAFDFDSMASLAMNTVYHPTPICYPTFNFWSGLGVHCSPSMAGTMGSMLIHFSEGGTFDLKQRNLLGLNTYDYYVYANGTILNETYTGEDLGNILYGYTCRNVGISIDNAIRYAGLADSDSNFIDTAACLFLNDQPRCDDADDIERIKLGWNHFS